MTEEFPIDWSTIPAWVGPMALITLGAGLVVLFALAFDAWTTRSLRRRSEAALLIVTWDEGDLTEHLPAWEPDQATKDAIKAFIPQATAAEAAATVAQVEAYLTDLPYDWREEGL